MYSNKEKKCQNGFLLVVRIKILTCVEENSSKKIREEKVNILRWFIK